MLIQTKLLGEVEIQPSEIITFEQGVPGFPDNRKFVLLWINEDLPIAMLQSTEDIDVNFVVAYPFAFKKDHAFDLSEQDKEDLNIKEQEDIVTYVVVTLKDTFEASTLNLLAPIIINTKNKLGKQIVLNDNEKFPLRYQIGVLSGSDQ